MRGSISRTAASRGTAAPAARGCVEGEIHYPNGQPLGLTAEEARAGHILMCQALPRSDLSVEARLIANVADVEIKTLPCRIARLERLAPDVMQVFLKLPSVEAAAIPGGPVSRRAARRWAPAQLFHRQPSARRRSDRAARAARDGRRLQRAAVHHAEGRRAAADRRPGRPVRLSRRQRAAVDGVPAAPDSRR